MAVEHKFFKQVVTSPTAQPVTGMPISFPIQLNNTLITESDLDSISVALNGQIIQKRTGAPRQFAKFYYEVTNNNTAYVANPSTTGVDALCSLTITVFANPDYAAVGYDLSTTHQVSAFSDADVLFVSFYHTVVRDA